MQFVSAGPVLHSHMRVSEVLSRLIWTPLKLVPPGTIFSEMFGPPPKNLFHYKGQRHEGKSVHASGPEGAKENQHVRVRCWSVLLATGSLKW